MRIFLPDADATIAFGKKIAANFRVGDIVKITGSLGAGKTTLVRGFVAGLGGDPTQVHSPTFALVDEYDSPIALINHCDFYRLPSESGLEEFGGLEFFGEDQIFFIEWPERIRSLQLPTSRRVLEADLQHDSTGRAAVLSSAWQIVD